MLKMSSVHEHVLISLIMLLDLEDSELKGSIPNELQVTFGNFVSWHI